MQSRVVPPRPPAPPRLESLTTRVGLGPAAVPDDALLQGVDAEAPAWDEHHSEFVELSGCRVRGGSMAGSHWYRTRWADLDIQGADLATLVGEESTGRCWTAPVSQGRSCPVAPWSTSSCGTACST